MSGAKLMTEIDFNRKVWSDDAFARALQEDPKTALKFYDIPVADDVEIRVVRDSDRLTHMCVPIAPPEGEISDTDLQAVQAEQLPFADLLSSA